ncbi:DJ-1/PfpI family protein [Kurthia sibirica]|uniref:Peptidase n=1 Tax=Kurthia sibirica TaxID=202750 RepID=A0A2U3ALB7_9BACL|nr:DJ-1/PfpI family protein [Kurthia sibirica]PWI25326.1 peptidase [Kurthia sibirica]GEK34428.1 protease [Kurthia sibirica]
MSKKILIIAGDAVEALEIYYPYYRCLEAGFDVTIAAPTVKKVQTVLHDFVDGMDTYIERTAYGLDATAAFSDVNPADFDGLIIPGGRMPEYIRLNDEIPSIVGHFFEAQKPIAAVCHAAQILAVIPQALQGRSLTAYIACKPEVIAAGATYIDEPVHTDKNLVSGHAWPDLPGLMREFMKLF